MIVISGIGLSGGSNQIGSIIIEEHPMPDPYNESWRDFVNVNRATWSPTWLPLPPERQSGTTIPDHAANCAAWGDAHYVVGGTEGYREWHAALPERVDPPQPPLDSGGGPRTPPPPPPKRD